MKAKKKYITMLIMSVAISMFLSGCKTTGSENPSNRQNLICESLDVMETIKDKDFEKLSNYVHPTKGVRFSPYFSIDMENDKVFTSQEVSNLGQSTEVFTWGRFDGSGESIDLNFNDYYDKFIYDQDYMNPHMIGGINHPIGKGNALDNIDEKYPDGKYVEYHFTGIDPQYDGMDWRSLRLVFEEYEGKWYLVGVVHGEWTI